MTVSSRWIGLLVVFARRARRSRWRPHSSFSGAGWGAFDLRARLGLRIRRRRGGLVGRHALGDRCLVPGLDTRDLLCCRVRCVLPIWARARALALDGTRRVEAEEAPHPTKSRDLSASSMASRGRTFRNPMTRARRPKTSGSNNTREPRRRTASWPEAYDHEGVDRSQGAGSDPRAAHVPACGQRDRQDRHDEDHGAVGAAVDQSTGAGERQPDRCATWFPQGTAACRRCQRRPSAPRRVRQDRAHHGERHAPSARGSRAMPRAPTRGYCYIFDGGWHTRITTRGAPALRSVVIVVRHPRQRGRNPRGRCALGMARGSASGTYRTTLTVVSSVTRWYTAWCGMAPLACSARCRSLSETRVAAGVYPGLPFAGFRR